MLIYGDIRSGNCQKVKITADWLGLSYDWHPVDVVAGQTRAPAYLAINPMGQVPAVILDDGRVLAQSNAIIRYLAHGSALLPEDPYLQAKIDEWMFWEQYSHEPYIAVCRYQMKFLGKRREELEAWRLTRGEAALDLMDQELGRRPWLGGDRISVADIALLAYTRLAGEGGFDIAPRRNIANWISRCEAELGVESRH
ncbi:MAG: glutathione S-transferase family protein [Rhizobiales bacterium]|nr:glutathione S-transferase family protein [Hyphomicrobiales bacterium]